MKICSFLKNNKIYLGNLKDDFVLPMADEKIDFQLYKNISLYKGQPVSINDLKIKSSLPKNRLVYGIADNFKSNNYPIVFFKGLTNYCKTMQKESQLIIDASIDNLWAEPELGFIIAKDINFKTTNNIDSSYIFGYFLANDITGSLRDEDHHLICSKSCQGFLQIGDFIDTSFNPYNQIINLLQDNIKLRENKLNERSFDEISILRYLSNFFNLRKGDAILTGAPRRCRDRMYLKEEHNLKLGIYRI